MKNFAFEELPSIRFKKREDFNEVSSWEFDCDDVIDICYSDMIIYFKDDDSLRSVYFCILMNHILDENLEIDGEIK